MSVNFTLDDVVAKVREVAAENPDHVYTKPSDDPYSGCMYRHGVNREEPGCIVGQALDRLGYEVPQLYEGTHAHGLLTDGLGFNPEAPQAAWVRSVQRNQDDGQPWGQAVEEADSYMMLPALR